MNKKEKNNNTNKCWRAFNIEMPDELIVLYDFLNQEYNKILSNKTLMKQIKTVDTTMLRGDYWRELRLIIGDDFQKWGLGANAWYARMIYENIRRIVKSGTERQTVHDLLLRHNNQPTQEFWDELHDNNCYPTSGVIRNVQREIKNNNFSDTPESAVFVMDYSTVSDAAIEKKVNEHRWLFRISKDKWADLEVLLPKNIRRQATGKVAKPRFMKRKRDNQYIGCISYELKIDEPKTTNKIMGVDIGKVKPFSAIAVDENGDTSVEDLASKKVTRLIEKFKRIEQNIKTLSSKQSRCECLVKSVKFDRRELELKDLRLKRRNLRTEIVRLLAFDIVSAALVEGVSELHVEDLSWLDSRGGWWNHSEVLRVLEDTAVIYGLKVVRVSAAYSSVKSPFDGEIGVVSGRDVVFSDGWVVDREVLADVNLACRCSVKSGRAAKVNEKFKKRKASRGCCVKKRRYRECLGDAHNNNNNNHNNNNNNVDYSEFFVRGGVDVVAFSVGVGDSSPANSTIRVANTKSPVLNVRKHNQTNKTQHF